jgi:hypothetical protein
MRALKQRTPNLRVKTTKSVNVFNIDWNVCIVALDEITQYSNVDSHSLKVL